jgi:hypothetical protein
MKWRVTLVADVDVHVVLIFVGMPALRTEHVANVNVAAWNRNSAPFVIRNGHAHLIDA